MRKLRSQHDAYFDRLVRGEAPSAGQYDESLMAFVDRTRRVGQISPGPSVEAKHMAAILETTQLFVDKGEPAARPASNATGPGIQASGLPKRRRKLVLSSLFASLSAKLAAGGIAVAMAATSGLAYAGKLPAPVQNTFANAADVVGIELPVATDEVEEEEAEEEVEEGTDEGTDPIEDEGEGLPEDSATSGKRSNEDVHAAINATEPGPARGKAVSEAARQKPASVNVPDSDSDNQNQSSSAAVHEAIDSTEAGPERGKAVSEAASGKARGGGDDTDDSDTDDDESQTARANQR